MTTSVRPVQADDFPQWLAVWQVYLEFNKTELPEEISRSTFDRCVDPEGDLKCFVAVEGDAVIGMVVYHYHASTWDSRPICYLEDLCTAAASRGKGVARALVEAVAGQAKADGCYKLYWHTDEDNYFGRILYDKLATNSGRIHYQRVLTS